MDPRKVHDDVYDPTTDPRHRPPTEVPGEDPNVPRPRDPTADDPPPGSEPTPVPVQPDANDDRPLLGLAEWR
ncbi:MAG TPA: hypothetical protein VKD90_22615 [Gemmataceae bacterium]|nr:hypothetical protein [Gemmataceae bacterium]